MPTYQYTCTDCGEPLEAVQKFSDDPLAVCPSCGGKLRKVFSPVGIVFKGSGFYRNDSRNGSSAAAAKTKEAVGSETAASNGSADGKATETKAAESKPTETKKSEPAAAAKSSEKAA